jgi:hypothetical protein
MLWEAKQRLVVIGGISFSIGMLVAAKRTASMGSWKYNIWC